MGKNLIIRGTTYPNVPDISVKNADKQSEEVVYRDTSDATLSSGGQMLDGVEGYGPDGKVVGNIPSRSASDLTANGATVTAPAGHYANPVSKQVVSGSASTPATTIQATPEITIDSTTGEITASVDASQSYYSGSDSGIRSKRHIRDSEGTGKRYASASDKGGGHNHAFYDGSGDCRGTIPARQADGKRRPEPPEWKHRGECIYIRGTGICKTPVNHAGCEWWSPHLIREVDYGKYNVARGGLPKC